METQFWGFTMGKNWLERIPDILLIFIIFIPASVENKYNMHYYYYDKLLLEITIKKCFDN